jgi:hypothetical protein
MITINIDGRIVRLPGRVFPELNAFHRDIGSPLASRGAE